jgi:NodT family efflux transporter outer membrane factor (OMF) lipoprotein
MKRAFKGFLLLVVCAAGISSCLTVPAPSSESALAAPPSIGATTAKALTHGAAAGQWPVDKWWEAFGDPGLNALVERALAGSPDIKIARARARLAMNVAKMAGAATSPKAGAGASLMGQRFSENSWLPVQFIQNPIYQADLALDLGYDLDLFGAAKLAAQGKTGAQKAAEVDIHAVRLGVSAAVTRSYLRLRNIQELLGIAGGAMASRGESLEMIRRKAEKGLETQLNVERARYAVTVVEDAITVMEGAAMIERNLLAALAGAGPDEGLAIPDPASSAPAPAVAPPENLPVDLIHRRPDVAAALWRVEAAAKNIGAARAAFYPNINLRALAGAQTTDLGKLLLGGSLTYTITSAIHLPLYDGGALSGALGAAHAEYDMAVERYNLTTVWAARETADALSQIDTVGRQLEVAGRALATAQKVHDLTMVRVKRGLDDYLTALKAQDDVFDQERKLASLKGMAAQARVALFAALGGGFSDGESTEKREKADGR